MSNARWKKSPATSSRYGKALATGVLFFKGYVDSETFREGRRETVFLVLFSATSWPWYSVFSLSAISARSVFCLL